MNHSLDYWKKRCELAESFIEESPDDPDVTQKQLEAYQKWQDFKNSAKAGIEPEEKTIEERLQSFQPDREKLYKAEQQLVEAGSMIIPDPMYDNFRAKHPLIKHEKDLLHGQDGIHAKVRGNEIKTGGLAHFLDQTIEYNAGVFNENFPDNLNNKE